MQFGGLDCMITKGVTEYIIHCEYCYNEDVTHEKSKADAIKTFKKKGWGVWPTMTICEYCLRH